MVLARLLARTRRGDGRGHGPRQHDLRAPARAPARAASLPPRWPRGAHLARPLLVHERRSHAPLRGVCAHLSPASRGASGAGADRRALRARRPMVSRRPHHRAHPGSGFARWPARTGLAPHHHLDRDRPLHPPLSRRGRLPSGSERPQRAPQRRRPGVSHRFRPRLAAQARPVARCQPGAPVPLARQDHRCTAARARHRGGLAFAARRLSRGG